MAKKISISLHVCIPGSSLTASSGLASLEVEAGIELQAEFWKTNSFLIVLVFFLSRNLSI